MSLRGTLLSLPFLAALGLAAMALPARRRATPPCAHCGHVATSDAGRQLFTGRAIYVCGACGRDFTAADLVAL